MSPILVTLTSHSDSNFERSNISLKENKRDGVDLNSNGLDYCVRKNKEKLYGFRKSDFTVILRNRVRYHVTDTLKGFIKYIKESAKYQEQSGRKVPYNI